MNTDNQWSTRLFLFQEYISSLATFLGCLLTTYIVIVVCRRDSSVDFTRSQYVINNLEEGRMAHLSSNNNVQCLFSDVWWGQLRLSTRRADKNSRSWWGPCCRCKPDCRCGVSFISIEPDQPVSKCSPGKE